MSADAEATPAAAPADAEPVTEAAAAPKKLVRVPRPDQKKFEAEQEAMQNQIAELLKQVNAIREEIRTTQEGTRDVSGKVSEARSRINVIREEQKALKASRQKYLDARNDLRTAQQSRAKAARASRDAMKYNNVEGLTRRIKELNLKQQTEMLSLTEEKNLVKELKSLNMALKKAKATESKTAAEAKGLKVEAGADQWQILKAQINAKNEELKVVHERMNAQYQILRKFEEERNTKGEALPALRQKRNQLSQQINELRQSRTEKRNVYFKARNEHSAYMREINKAKYEARRKEHAKERELAAEAERKREEEEANRKPYLEEIALCDALIAQLRGLRPADESKGSEAVAATDVSLEVDGVVLQPRQEEDIDPWAMGTGGKKGKKGKKGRKGKKGKGRKSSAAAPLKLDLDTHACFATVKAEAPRTVGGIDAAITALQERRNYYDTAPRPVKKKRAARGPSAAAGAGAGAGESSVTTPYGAGKLVEVRASDGMRVVKLPFGIAYMREEDVTSTSA